MVIGLLAIAAIPTVTGVGQAISAQKKQNAAAKEQEKCYMSAMLPTADGKGFEEAGSCVLVGGRLLLDLPEAPLPGHKFCGYYFKYPSEEGHLGLVSTIMDDPPMLNWVFVDKDTGAFRYGARKDTIDHVIGPFGWSSDEEFFTLKGQHRCFVAVRQQAGDRAIWGVFWDPEGEILQAYGSEICKPCRLMRKPVLGIGSSYKGGVRAAEREAEERAAEQRKKEQS